jgi:hypothetical protein
MKLFAVRVSHCVRCREVFILLQFLSEKGKMLPEKFAGCRFAAGDLQLSRTPHEIRSNHPAAK